MHLLVHLFYSFHINSTWVAYVLHLKLQHAHTLFPNNSNYLFSLFMIIYIKYAFVFILQYNSCKKHEILHTKEKKS